MASLRNQLPLQCFPLYEFERIQFPDLETHKSLPLSLLIRKMTSSSAKHPFLFMNVCYHLWAYILHGMQFFLRVIEDLLVNNLYSLQQEFWPTSIEFLPGRIPIMYM